MRMLVIICMCFFFSLPAFAQSLDALTAPDAENEFWVLDLPLEDIPEGYLIEAEFQKNKCLNSGLLNTYYDCECRSLHYLQERMLGPENQDSSAIEMDIADKCIDVTNAAGNMYNRCLGMGPMLPKNQSVEGYCECVGNTYATLFRDNNLQPSSRNFTNLQAMAMIRCNS